MKPGYPHTEKGHLDLRQDANGTETIRPKFSFDGTPRAQITKVRCEGACECGQTNGEGGTQKGQARFETIVVGIAHWKRTFISCGSPLTKLARRAEMNFAALCYKNGFGEGVMWREEMPRPASV